MKKILTFIIGLIIFIPFSVKAIAVNELNATISGNTITYNGTMEDGSYAVMCKLLDKDSNEIDMLSTAVDSNKFEGTFTVESNGDYKVSCANYEGGDIKTVDVKVETATETTTTGETTKTVPTGDNVKTYVIIAMVSIIAIAGATVYLKKRVKNN